MQNFEWTRLPVVHFENATPAQVANYFGAVVIWGADTNTWWQGSSWPVLALKGTNQHEWANTARINYTATNVLAVDALEAVSKSTGFEFKVNGWGRVWVKEKAAQP